MSDVFMCHVEEDYANVLQIAEGLEGAGFSTWYYERDSVPGVSYLIETSRAIEECSAILLFVSRNSVGSHQVAREVERAYECDKLIIPVLIDISHDDLIAYQPTWRLAMGTIASIILPEDGAASITPYIVKGLKQIGIQKREKIGPVQLMQPPQDNQPAPLIYMPSVQPQAPPQPPPQSQPQPQPYMPPSQLQPQLSVPEPQPQALVLQSQAPVYDPLMQKSRFISGLMGIFLGCTGAHNFYLGNKINGVMQLLFTILSMGFFFIQLLGYFFFIPAIWGLLEGILILTGGINMDGRGIPLKK